MREEVVEQKIFLKYSSQKKIFEMLADSLVTEGILKVNPHPAH